jgi:hypothetical protein
MAALARIDPRWISQIFLSIVKLTICDTLMIIGWHFV